MKLSEQIRELPSGVRNGHGGGYDYNHGWEQALEKAAQLVAAHEKVRVVCGYCEAVLTDAPDAFAAHDTVCERNPLVKRVAELEAIVTDISPEHNVLALLDAWQDETMTLRKRVAELEMDVVRLRSFETLAAMHRKTITELESQLAWTPVSDWPSEPGCYEFTDGTCEDTACYELEDNRWFGKSMDNARSPLDVYPYTMFRRIELPGAS